ncbi:branched-chain amino acid ABC transporter permease [uncultured Eubacterium sp.]|uniref:branched-chain amino acid ABC transporter permease n=2 Tax=Eubacterium TaxID=1730 RepID=UPI0025D5469F|nr:branched-chain amino acid ABC transporter permease [uncultured Eubacterium sp.]MDO4363919.1 branched-chain amino acid ABC transporter permease [Clostridia bacterium]
MNGLAQTIITAGAVVTACLTVFGVGRSFAKYLCSVKDRARTRAEHSTAQDKDIARLKEENQLICYGLSAALDGLEQLGANHSVPIAKNKLQKYLNEQAHK